ncbi:Gfo/Idh/MocA family protein [Nesterenkonia sandarakina]|uniref:Putative dehydrogenase n=1 Tax=Nesterenkonia sandarakina TaxID=272918 RepID=A0A7Z0J328_9MICC|nr:Gfo/Idh/MocA family oxidoreductase [Nesterenkonia sandarakina]NYJ16328.1 putative dehydrogenase [Nesterenkonia sandarakina]
MTESTEVHQPAPSSAERPLRVAIIGHAFMGVAHTHAWRTAPRFFPMAAPPELALLVGRDEARTRAAAERLEIAEIETDWRRAVEREDIDVVDICTPGNTHAEIALAALAAGKHVLCEKPLANSVAEAEAMTAAAERAAARGVRAFCGFSYRRTPALALAKRFVEEGRLGEIRHVRAQYLQDWLSDADTPLNWRLEKDKAGSGALGDIGAHSVDAAQWVSGQRIEGVSAMLHTFVETRPLAGTAQGLGGSAEAGAPRGPVTVDDAAAFTARFDGGAIGVFEATRFAQGRRNANRLEINGSSGSIAFDFESMNTLEYFDARDDQAAQGFRTIQVTDAVHPYTDHWWPVGHGLGYGDLFVHQVADVVAALQADTAAHPDFAEALTVQRVLHAVEASARNASRYTSVDRPDSQD